MTTPSTQAASDREIVITRTIEAPARLVFMAYTEVRHLSRWWGPFGFTTTTESFDFRPGGEWIFTMHGPDGIDYANWIEFREIDPPRRLAFLHGESAGDPETFETVIDLIDRGATTEVVMRSIFPTKERRDFVVERYGAIEGGQQTLARLAEFVAGLQPELHR